jgi:hypothetical protein
MGGDVAMDQAPAAVLNDHKHIQQTKGRGHGNEEMLTSPGVVYEVFSDSSFLARKP